MLHRILIEKGIPENFQLISFDSDTNLCPALYVSVFHLTPTEIICDCVPFDSDIYMATNLAPSSHIPMGQNFLFLFFRPKLKNQAMLCGKTFIGLLDTSITLMEIKGFSQQPCGS